jgi:hypothetical protein
MLETGRLVPPFKPNMNDINAADQESIGTFEETKEKLTPEDQAAYKDWDFVSGDAVAYEIVDYLQWEAFRGAPITPAKNDSGCCTIL